MNHSRATNHAGYSAYTYAHATGWTIGAVRTTEAEALADMAAMPEGGQYAVREAVLLGGKIV